MRNSRMIVAVCVVCLSGLVTAGRADELLKVHEWGTFTSFQDERGGAFARINTDDEPVPKFVHQLFYEGRFSPTGLPHPRAQGDDWADPEVTMRLETPVTYFHLPASREEMTLDVSVAFQGGWLTEFYPAAAAEVNGRNVDGLKKERLSTSTVGSLSWFGVRLGAKGEGPKTEERVWLAPRDVRAAQVTVGTQSERFLFYRGVGHRDAPLRIVRPTVSDQLELRSLPADSPAWTKQPMRLAHLWLVEIMPDGTAAFRVLPEINVDGRPDQLLATTSATFANDEFSPRNLGALRAAMHTALVEQGLFADEAAALLNTWELSYFQSPGLRLFFLLPQTWTDEVLPLKLSVPAEVTRAMVGRIEIVTPRQRDLIQKIARLPLANLKDVSMSLYKLSSSTSAGDLEKYNALASGRGNPGDLGVPVPESYQAFLDLGRFRTSLLLSSLWDGKQSNRRLANFAFELQVPGYAYQRAVNEQAERDDRDKRRRVAMERRLQDVYDQDRRQPPPKNGVLFLGGSAIARWNLAKSFPDQLVIQRGFDRFHLADAQGFVGNVAATYEPRLIVLHAGARDILATGDPEEALSKYRALVTEVHQKLPKTRIAYIAVDPNPTQSDDFDRFAEANRLIRELTQNDDRLTFVDVVSPMLGAEGRPRPELYNGKSEQLSEQGYELWTKLLKPVLNGDAQRTSVSP
jgi:hypothetical protein